MTPRSLSALSTLGGDMYRGASQKTPEALAYVKHMDSRIVVIDGKRLAELMIAHDVGVSTERTYQVNRADPEFFDETIV